MNNRPLIIFAAGSLKTAFRELILQFEEQHDVSVRSHFGPAGLLAKKIQQGAYVDLFASANEAHPDSLVEYRTMAPGKVFATNQLCVFTRPELNVNQDNLIARLADPNIVVSTSTPISDPGGDYALQVFEKIEALHPGLGIAIKNKAQHLLGGNIPAFSTTNPAHMPAAAKLIMDRRSDIHVGYASHTQTMNNLSGISIVPLPSAYQITARYKYALNKNISPAAVAFADYLLSSAGQEHLVNNGFGYARTREMALSTQYTQ